jgi:transcriptional regulator with XRE-family HTH domain
MATLQTELRKIRDSLVPPLILSQAAKIGKIPRATLSRWEQGKVKPRACKVQYYLTNIGAEKKIPFILDLIKTANAKKSLTDLMKIKEMMPPLKELSLLDGLPPHKGELIAALRAREGFSQIKFADKTAILNLSRIESGNSYLSQDSLAKIRDSLDLTPKEMLLLSDLPNNLENNMYGYCSLGEIELIVENLHNSIYKSCKKKYDLQFYHLLQVGWRMVLKKRHGKQEFRANFVYSKILNSYSFLLLESKREMLAYKQASKIREIPSYTMPSSILDACLSAQALGIQGYQNSKAIKIWKDGIKHAEEGKRWGSLSLFQRDLATALLRSRNFDEADNLSRESCKHAEKSGAVDLIEGANLSRAIVLATLGNSSEALARMPLNLLDEQLIIQHPVGALANLKNWARICHKARCKDYYYKYKEKIDDLVKNYNIINARGIDLEFR